MEAYFPFVRAAEATQAEEQGAFADPGGANQGHEISRPQFEVEVPENPALPAFETQVTDSKM